MPVSQQYSRADFAEGDIQWLLVLRVRGVAYRVSSRGANVANSDTTTGPATLQFHPGLDEPSVSQSVAWGDAGTEGREASVSMVFPTVEGWGAIANADHDLCDATAELSLWVEGSDFVDRWVVVRGSLEGLSYAEPGEPVAFTITQNPWEDRSQVPPIGAQATTTTWPRTNSTGFLLPFESVDLWYPYVFGCPGVARDDDESTPRYGWPVYVVEVVDEVDAEGVPIGDNFTDFGGGAEPVVVLIAGHAIAATEVRLYNVTTNLYADVLVTRTTDLLGRVVSIATVADVVTDPTRGLNIALGEDLQCSFLTTTAGGMVDDTGATMRGAGILARWFLRQASGLTVDQGDMTSALALLDGFRFDFYLDEPKTAWEHLSDEILIHLPASTTIARSGGLSLVVWPWTARDIDALGTIDPDVRGGARSSAVEMSSPTEVYTDIRIEYAHDSVAGVNTRHLTISPRTEGDAIGNVYLFSAWSRLQVAGRPEVRRTLTIEVPSMGDPASASALAQAWARRHSSTRRTLSFDLPPAYLMVRPGTPWLAASSDAGMTSRLCVVTDLSPRTDGCSVTVETMPDVVREQGDLS